MVASTKCLLKKLTSSCLVLPDVAALLLNHGCTREQVNAVIDTDGADWCLQQLKARGVHVRSDGGVQLSEATSAMVASQIPWAQAMRVHSKICVALEDAERAVLFLSMAEPGDVSGKWLAQYPSGWRPKITDDCFQVAVRWRLGLPVVTEGALCKHVSCRNKLDAEPCNVRMDAFGGHCIICGFGAFRFARHDAVNSVLAEAGKEAGYTVLEEQVVPEFCITLVGEDGAPKVQEARLDIELFLHPVAPDRLLDGTVRHPTAAAHRQNAAAQIGATARAGVADKARRYPPRGGRHVLC
jgi:hypothetical protein